MQNIITKTDLNIPNCTSKYIGKVRDVYNISNDLLVMVTTDRISAFDVVLPRAIPYKGQVLNQIASTFLDNTSDIVPNWKIATPDPMVTVGRFCEPFKVEMVVRAYLTGHAWREYKAGKRTLCGVPLPDRMKEHDKFDKPIITPTTKEEDGHDQDISAEEIVSKGLVSKSDYEMLEDYTYKLFERGTQMADQRGLILVDTKYEFGKRDGQIFLIDEIHTPDSSRYFYKEGYQQRQDRGEQQKQLSKEFVREWLIENGFQGLEGQAVPNMSDGFVNQVSERYIELYEKITGNKFVKTDTDNVAQRVQNNVSNFISSYYR